MGSAGKGTVRPNRLHQAGTDPGNTGKGLQRPKRPSALPIRQNARGQSGPDSGQPGQFPGIGPIEIDPLIGPERSCEPGRHGRY